MRPFAFLLTLAAAVAAGAAPPVGPADPDNDTPAKERRRTVTPLKLLALAAHNYESANGTFPPAAIADKAGKPLLSWRVALCAYLQDDTAFPVYKKFKLDEPWDSAHNAKVVADNPMPDVYKAKGFQNVGAKETLFQAFTGNGALFDGPPRKIVGIADGTSNTILFAVSKTPVPWTKPADMPFDPKANPADQLYQSASGQCFVTFADGGARAVKAGNPAATWRAAVTAAGGENSWLKD